MELQEILLDFLETVWRKEDMYYDANDPKWHIKMVDDFITENEINLSLGNVIGCSNPDVDHCPNTIKSKKSCGDCEYNNYL